MSKRYTEGIAFDGAAILDNGQPITITEILDRLNDEIKVVYIIQHEETMRVHGCFKSKDRAERYSKGQTKIIIAPLE